MTNPTHLVVSPPTHQGSVLGRIIAGDDRLGEILAYLVRWKSALESSIAETLAELAALRTWTTPAFEVVREKLFSFRVGNDVEPSSGKSALELCWETLERVQYLNRRIALHQSSALYQPNGERIERSGKFYYFLIRVVGIAGGDVAASKAMAPHLDRRVRDYEAEAACPNYLIESFKDVPLPRRFDPISPEVQAAFKARFLSEKEKVALDYIPGIDATHHLRPITKYAFPETRLSIGQDSIGEDCTDEQIAAWYPYIYRGVPNRSSVPNHFYLVTNEPEAKKFVAPPQEWVDAEYNTFLKLRREFLENIHAEEVNRLLTNKNSQGSDEDYAARHKNNESVSVPHLPNFCTACLMWVTMRHDHTHRAADNPLRTKTKARTNGEQVLPERLSSWLTDRDILIARGKDSTDPAVRKIDKVLKEKYGYRVRKSTSKGDGICPPQEFKLLRPERSEESTL